MAYQLLWRDIQWAVRVCEPSRTHLGLLQLAQTIVGLWFSTMVQGGRHACWLPQHTGEGEDWFLPCVDTGPPWEKDPWNLAGWCGFCCQNPLARSLLNNPTVVDLLNHHPYLRQVIQLAWLADPSESASSVNKVGRFLPHHKKPEVVLGMDLSTQSLTLVLASFSPLRVYAVHTVLYGTEFGSDLRQGAFDSWKHADRR